MCRGLRGQMLRGGHREQSQGQAHIFLRVGAGAQVVWKAPKEQQADPQGQVNHSQSLRGERTSRRRDHGDNRRVQRRVGDPETVHVQRGTRPRAAATGFLHPRVEGGVLQEPYPTKEGRRGRSGKYCGEF